MNCFRQPCIFLLLQAIFLVADRLAESLILDVNFKRPIAVTSRAFLSLTVDPAALLNNADVKNVERSINMARGLVPAYIRFGGPQSNSCIFKGTYVDTDLGDMLFGASWTSVHRWASDAGLDMIACIAPHYIASESKMHFWDSTNVAQLLTFSDRMGYNVSWQLGYECQTRCNLSGRDLGRYTANMREMLKTFPRYSSSLIAGPDIVAYKTARQQKYLHDYFDSAGAALSAITWHPDFTTATLNNDGISVHYDDIAVEKDELYKIIDRTTGKKPLWIAESRLEDGKHQYLGALIWTRRLGNVAKLGVQVLMRQMSDLNKATPDYWISLLHKTLVGREVLEVNVLSNNESHVHFYSQCTKPSILYDKGAITIFGVNVTPKDVTAKLKGLRTKTLHKYIISPDSQAGNKMFSEKVLLNDKPLDLTNDKTLPDLRPEIITDLDVDLDIELKLSSGGIGFWVISDAKVKACIHSEEETIKSAVTEKLPKRHANIVRRADREEGKKEEEENEEEDIKQSDMENRKTWKDARHERRNQRNMEKEHAENQQKMSKSQLLLQLRRILQKGLRQKGKNDSSRSQKSSTSVSTGEQANSLDETKKQKNLDEHFKETKEIGDKIETNYNVRDTTGKYKRSLMKERTQTEAERLKEEMWNIDNVTALMSKVETSLQFNEEDASSDNIKDKTKNERELMIEANSKLKEESNRLEDYDKSTTNMTEKIGKYFNVPYNLLKDSKRIKEYNEQLLKDDEQIKEDRNNHLLVCEYSTNEERPRRDLSTKLDDLKRYIHEKRSRLDDLKNQIKGKTNSKNNDKTLLMSKLRHFDNNQSNRHSLRQCLKRVRDDSFANHRIDPRHLAEEHRQIKRNMHKRSTESLRKDIRRRSRIDDVRDYVNERKTKLRSDLKKDGLPNQFNARTESDENNFYGFSRRDPIKGFPKGDVYFTTGDSKERSGQDYDYVEDNDDDPNKKNTQRDQECMANHAEDDTWIERDGDHRDYVPNEFFENVKLSNTKIEKDATDYGDLYEAEFLSGKTQGNNEDDNKMSHADSPINLHRSRAKRSDRKKLLTILAEEMINENEDNARDYRCRVIRTPNLPKEPNDYRAKHDNQETMKSSTDSSTKTGNANGKLATNLVRSKRSIENPTTKEEYERIMTGEILPSTSVIETGFASDEPEVITEITAELRGSNHKPRDVKQTNDVHLTSSTLGTETNDATEQYSGGNRFITEDLLIDSSSANNINATQQERTFFRGQSPGTPAEFEKTTYDPVQIVHKVSPNDGGSRERYTASRTASETTSLHEKEEEKKEETEQELIGSIIENRTDAERKRSDNYGNYEVDRKMDGSFEEITEIAENRTMARTILSKRTANESNDDLKSSETEMTRKSQRNAQDNHRARKCADRTYAKEEGNSKRKRVTLKDFPSMPLRELARHEEHLVRRAKQIEKLRERLDARRGNLMLQYQHGLTKIANEEDDEKRNLRKREAWERLRKHDYLHPLTDQGKFVGILVSNDDIRENDDLEDEKYVEAYLPVEFVRKRFDISQNRAYPRANVKYVRNYPERNPYNQIFGYPKVHDAHERGSIEEASSYTDYQILAVDPSTYHGGEPVLQAHEDYLEDRSEYLSKRKPLSQIQSWTLEDLYKMFSETKQSYEDQHKSDELYESYDYDYPEDTKEEPIEDFLNLNKQKNSTALRILNEHKPYNASNERLVYLPILLNLLEQLNINKTTEDKALNELNNLDSTDRIIEHSIKTADQRDLGIESYTRNTRDEIKKISNIAMTKDAEDTEDVTEPENFNVNEEVMLNDRRFKNTEFSIESEDPNKKENINEKTESAIVIVKKMYDSSDNVKEISNNNTKVQDVGIINNGNAIASIHEKKDIRTRRNIERQISDYLDKSLYILFFPDKTNEEQIRNEVKHGENMKDEFNGISDRQPIPFLRLTKLPSDAIELQKPGNNVVSSFKSSGAEQQDGKKCKLPRYAIMPTKIEDFDSYEMLKMRSPENFRNFKISNWHNQYLPRKITDSMARYSSDLSSTEYKNFINMINKSTENNSNEEVSYSLECSNENIKQNQRILKDFENINRESRKEDEQYNIKSEGLNRYLKIKDQTGPDKHQIFMMLSWLNGKTTRQRRQIESEIDKSRTYKYIMAEDAKHERDGYLSNKNNINKKEITGEKYPQFQKDKENRDDFLKDFINVRRNDIVKKNEKNDKMLKNNILTDYKKLPFFMEKTIPKSQNHVDGLKKIQNITESVEQFVDPEKRFNKTLIVNEDKLSNNRTSENNNDAFYVAITNVRKFFMLLSGLSRILSV